MTHDDAKTYTKILASSFSTVLLTVSTVENPKIQKLTEAGVRMPDASILLYLKVSCIG